MSKEVQLITRLFTDLIKGEGARLSLDVRLSDIFVRINRSTGEIHLLDSEDEVLSSATIFNWIAEEQECGITTQMCEQLREAIAQLESKGFWDSDAFARPFSIVLVDENWQTIEELLYLDDEHVLLTSPLLSGVDEELRLFLQELLQESK